MKWLDKVCERGQKCTCFIDRFGKWDWSECCGKHDDCYASNATNEYCDKRLLGCVKQKAGRILAYIMYCGVSTFGNIFR